MAVSPAELRSEVMEALQKEVRSLDDNGWMFAAPRPRINLVSRPVCSFEHCTSKDTSSSTNVLLAYRGLNPKTEEVVVTTKRMKDLEPETSTRDTYG